MRDFGWHSWLLGGESKTLKGELISELEVIAVYGKPNGNGLKRLLEVVIDLKNSVFAWSLNVIFHEQVTEWMNSTPTTGQGVVNEVEKLDAIHAQALWRE
jgi:hypothetical protein